MRSDQSESVIRVITMATHYVRITCRVVRNSGDGRTQRCYFSVRSTTDGLFCPECLIRRLQPLLGHPRVLLLDQRRGPVSVRSSSTRRGCDRRSERHLLRPANQRPLFPPVLLLLTLPPLSLLFLPFQQPQRLPSRTLRRQVRLRRARGRSCTQRPPSPPFAPL